MGTHNHPEREMFPRDVVHRATELVKKHVSLNPSLSPSMVQNFTAKDLVQELHLDSIADLLIDEEK